MDMQLIGARSRLARESVDRIWQPAHKAGHEQRAGQD
jgi:hypothetical protein